MLGGYGPLFESLQAALQMKKHTSDCLGDHTPLKLCSQTQVSESGDVEEMDEGNTCAGVEQREQWELMGLELQ